MLVRAVIAKLRDAKARHSLGRAMRTGLGLLLTGQFRAFRAKLAQALGGAEAGTALYELWREQHKLSDGRRAELRAEAEKMEAPLRISLLMAVGAVPVAHLRTALESVVRQVYPFWELCVVGDVAADAGVRAVLEAYAGRDQRIRLTFRQSQNNIATALNVALEAATGHYAALLGAEDELDECALHAVAQAVARSPDTDLLYSDEDCVDARGRYCQPFLKPDWSPEYFLACAYTGRLSVCRTVLAREAGGFRGDSDASLDSDLMLRLMARRAHIGHVPEVLYHRRFHAGPGVPALPWADVSVGTAAPGFVRGTVEEYLAAIGQSGVVERGPAPGLNRVRYAVTGKPKVSIIIPSRCQLPVGRTDSSPYVVRCVESIIQRSTWKDFEILVLDRNEMPAAMAARFKESGVRRVSYSEPFNWSRVNNLGAANATGSQLLFLNDDVEIITADWLECLLEFSQQADVGAVGAKLLFPDGRLQHAGVFILAGDPGHPYYTAAGDDPGYFFSNVVPRNYSAVTGACLMTRADVFHGLGGFDESFGLNYNDVDYCLRVIESGRRVVCTPYARCYHHESVSKAGTFPEELAKFRARWPRWCERDPFFHVNALEFAGHGTVRSR